MSQISLPSVFVDNTDQPLPLMVAQRWNFNLRTLQANGVVFYRLSDWLKALVDDKYASQTIRNFRRPGGLFEKYVRSTHTSTETDSMNRDQTIEYVTDTLLYRATLEVRLTKKRKELTLLTAIKEFLSESGAFVDLIRREPETVITSGAIDPDAAIDAAIEEYRKRGKDDRWINARISGKVKRAKFVAALKAAVDDILGDYHYATATDDIYLGLWDRTTAKLKSELGLSKHANLRDNQPTLALTYQGLAEEVAAQRLGDQTELSWHEARKIVRIVANLIGLQAKETSQFLGTDLATGKPLLADGKY